MFCTDIPDPVYFLFSEFTPQILYYSHMPTMLAALVLGVLVFLKARTLASKFLLLIAVLFAIWSVSDLFLWTHSDSRTIMFVWSYLNLLQSLISLAIVFFIYAYLNQKIIPVVWKTLLFVVFLIPTLLITTELNLEGFNQFICEGTEGTLILYFRALDIALLTWAFVYLAHKTYIAKNRAQVFTFSVGVLLFMLSFTGTNIFGSITGLWAVQQYGLFGMPIFLGVLVMQIVHYQAFRIRQAGSIALVLTLLITVGSLLFVHNFQTVRIIVAATFVLLALVGLAFINVTQRELKQKEEIQKLADNLAKANKRLKVLDQMKTEFVSIASHQLRSPLTSIRGYTSMLLDGSFGKLPKKAKEGVERIAESSRFMALSVEDYLNVSRIESGRMKYEMSDFNIREIAERIVDDVRPTTIKKGLLLTFKSSGLSGRGRVYADIGKTQQIIHNLLDNAIKYTPKGKITVTVRDSKKDKKVYVEVTDTGVGMSPETIHDVFDKFVRARNANHVNVTGTGLGLFVARQMAEGMDGSITLASPGEGKGSTFTLILPLPKTR